MKYYLSVTVTKICKMYVKIEGKFIHNAVMNICQVRLIYLRFNYRFKVLIDIKQNLVDYEILGTFYNDV